MNDEKTKKLAEFKEWSKLRIVELDDYFKLKPSKDKKYWHLRGEYVTLYYTVNELSMEDWNLDYMKLCIECLQYYRENSIEELTHWKSYWMPFVMDSCGEAHSRVGTPFYTTREKLAVGTTKEKLEQIIELAHKVYDI
jgi:hypothetical protein